MATSPVTDSSAALAPVIGYVYDDGGRQEAGFSGRADNCVARALPILAGRPYRALAQAYARAGGKRSARDCIRKGAELEVFRSYGLVKVDLGRGLRPTYSPAH